MAFASRPYAERGDRHAPREAPVVHAKADDARATFECLGARPFSVKLEEVFGGSVAHRPPATSVVDNEAEVTTA